MSFFNRASQVYAPEELDAMRHCFSRAAILLEASGRSYDETELANKVLRLYDRGMRDLDGLSELAARLSDGDPGDNVLSPGINS